MSLASRVARLEMKRRQVLRCTWCRFLLIDVPQPVAQQYDNAPDSMMPTKCWFCGTRYLVPLRGLNSHQREAFDLIYNSHPTKQFTDERVHAAGIWSALYRSEVKKYERTKQEQGAQPGNLNSAFDRAHDSGSGGDKKAKRRYEELVRQALDFHHAQTARFKRLVVGEVNPFPLDEALGQIEEEYPTSSYDKGIDDIVVGLGFEKYSPAASELRTVLATCNVHLQRLKKREACEVVIWDAALPETLLEIEFFEEEKRSEVKKTPCRRTTTA